MATTPTITIAEVDGLVLVKDADANATAEKNVLAGPCRLKHIHVTNPNAAVAYLKLYDSVNPTVGTDAPEEIYECAGSGTEGGVTDLPVNGGAGILFETGLSYAAVTTGGTAGTTGPTSDVTVVLHLERVS